MDLHLYGHPFDEAGMSTVWLHERRARLCVVRNAFVLHPQYGRTLKEDSGRGDAEAQMHAVAFGALSLREALGDDSPAVKELERLWELAKAYGYEDWLVLDLSVVRGLAYYTGIVFEGFDRSGELRGETWILTPHPTTTTTPLPPHHHHHSLFSLSAAIRVP